MSTPLARKPSGQFPPPSNGASPTVNRPPVVFKQQIKPESTGCIGRWIKLAVLVVVLAVVARFLDGIKDRWYMFDPTYLHELSRTGVETYQDDTQAIINHIVQNLTETYGTQHINTNVNEWVFNNAGGAMGAMYVIHSSITEYLIIFGTPLGTEGHSGRHTADDYFNIIHGEQWAYAPPSLVKEVYPAGSVHHLPRGSAKQYKMHEGCFALEYARGWIPPMLPFGFADTFTSTLDVTSLVDTVWISIREMGRNLLVGKI
ncbi:C-8 sterol isomerase [Tulasnella sp. 403]|nr:C-8 sterol isomerase [Tulasnella sp. 403]